MRDPKPRIIEIPRELASIIDKYAVHEHNDFETVTDFPNEAIRKYLYKLYGLTRFNFKSVKEKD